MSIFRRKPAAPPGPTTLPVDPQMGDPDLPALRRAVISRDWPALRTILEGAEDHDELDFFVSHATDVPGSEVWFADLVRGDLGSGHAQLLQGVRLIEWAWEARTGALARNVTRDQFALFFERLRMAEDCLQGVVRRDPDNATAWSNLITVAMGLQLGVDEARARFEKAVAVHPGHMGAHRAMQQVTLAKWGGSDELADEFAHTSMTSAPPGSPLGSLVAQAHMERRIKAKDGATWLAHMRSPAVRADLHAAADRSVRHPDYRRPRRAWAGPHNVFAAAFGFASEYRAALEQFEAVGDTVTANPWQYFDEPGRVFCAIRNECRAKAR